MTAIEETLAAWDASTGPKGWLRHGIVHGMECPCRLVREPAKYECTCGLRAWTQAIVRLRQEP